LLFTLFLVAYPFLSNMAGFEWSKSDYTGFSIYVFFIQNYPFERIGLIEAWILGATWSLAVEEQFYLVIPFIIRNSRRNLLYILLLLILSAPVIRAFTGHFSYNWTVCRSDSLIMGVLLAFFWRRDIFKMFVRNNKKLVLSLFIVMLFVAAVMSYKLPHVGGIMNHFLLAILYSLFILIVVSGIFPVLSVLLSGRLLVWLGQRSYGIYLFHGGILFIIHWFLKGEVSSPQIMQSFDVYLTVSSLLLTFLFAELSFHFIEKPSLSYGHSWKFIR